jgi:HTH-type transcriptional regulator / antitoxin HigA
METMNTKTADRVIRVIKTDAEYTAALSEIERLMDQDPAPNTPPGARLELLALLVQQYEAGLFPTELPDPIAAIEFRMEQQGLAPRDLVPYIGSRSKVSEVLARKRPLTLSMTRALHSGLGIPGNVLLQPSNGAGTDHANIAWEQFPVKEMAARGWLHATLQEALTNPERVLRKFFAPSGGARMLSLNRKTEFVRSARPANSYALAAWTGRVCALALGSPPAQRYKPGTVTLEFMRKAARLSWSDSGPRLVCEFLGKHGIAVVVERHLRKTYLDGAAIMLEKGRPVIGLTLRHDRLDNFWFTLMHELAHIALHLGTAASAFYDDLELEMPEDAREREADQLAEEALIPRVEWERSEASSVRSPEAVQELAEKLSIHPAIVAGRIRHQTKSYRVLSQFGGSGELSKHFEAIKPVH